MLRSLLYFLIAGICEIGGGYLVWISLREQRSILLPVQPSSFYTVLFPLSNPLHLKKSTPLTAVSLSSYLFYGVFG